MKTFDPRHKPPGQPACGMDASRSEMDPASPEGYTRAEMEAIGRHIRQYFGSYEHVFHEPVSNDLSLDICVVPPTMERDYCTLITLGMGARRMGPPEEPGAPGPERAELAIALPAAWKRAPGNCRDERWYWPVHLLKGLARLSAGGAGLAPGCIMDHQKPFASSTWLCAALLTQPFSAAPGGAVCPLPGGGELHFYQVLPLYRDELKYSQEHGTAALLEKMAAIGFVARPDRPDAITQGILRRAEDAANDILEMDNAIWHLATLRKKKLPVDEGNAFSHMTIYLRWSIEHDLMGAAFLEDYGSVIQQFKADPASVDLRAFLRDRLNGQLFSMMFNRTGRAFASYYYGYSEDPPHYPRDIDAYAVGVIGPERNDSEEIQDEAYLFLPFDEAYYQAMARTISRRFAGWQRQAFDPDTLEPSDLARALMHYLDCECTYFPSMKDDDPLSAACCYARLDSRHQGFVPVFIRADDRALWQCLRRNTDPRSDGTDDHAFDPDKAAACRSRMRAAPVKDGRAVLEALARRRRAEAPGGRPGRKEAMPGQQKDGWDSGCFPGRWREDGGMTHPLILAYIPVGNPWEVFAWLPFGDGNHCPDTLELMAAAKYWFEQYGAVPAAIGHQRLVFALPAPVPREKAMEAAAELAGLCPGVLGPGPADAALAALAHQLQQSTLWPLRWD